MQNLLRGATFARELQATLLGEQQRLSRFRPRNDEEADDLLEQEWRQQEAFRAIRLYELVRLVGGYWDLMRMPAEDVELIWMVHQARMEAEAEQNRRSEAKARTGS